MWNNSNYSNCPPSMVMERKSYQVYRNASGKLADVRTQHVNESGIKVMASVSVHSDTWRIAERLPLEVKTFTT